MQKMLRLRKILGVFKVVPNALNVIVFLHHIKESAHHLEILLIGKLGIG